MRRSLRDKRVVLTGASTGIGRVLALRLAREGARLVLVARNQEKLAGVAEEARRLGGEAVVCAGDVTDPIVRTAALQTAKAEFGGLDLLINNAGVSALGRFVGSDPDRLRSVMELNLFAAAELIRGAAPMLADGDDPLVVNMGSVLGHVGAPHNSEYCASKFALRGLSEAIRPELRRSGIGLLLVSPGTVATEFFDHVVDKRNDPPWGKPRGVTPERVARRTVRAMKWRRREIVVGCAAHAMVLANRLFPRLVRCALRRYG
ncbi:Diacetyl reductase [(S)-acetoin forming] [Pseudobythopirellula maris]|uniref:Diacetyl reductase [(S)-acetoin forming] n=1 Tax=Pseudobythopirellula maris TaxID=2527991 RepID=A0A5C5ZT56_9BACT|nr:SDR family NAD(P)-dependent oxidoreductase [Pseudobythopirellula maris]TWT90699.1 Diacetyl reductase [(S)-acetoin forming] [Pseudobythopirellula maris]